MSNTVIDVLIPVFNGATTVESAIESIQRQTHRELRIHVVDDGSTDATPQILARMAAADDRIQVHRQQNGGIVAALNFGLTFCTAEYLARHDADDLAYPNRLQVQLDYLEADPAYVAVGCAVRHIDGDGKPTGSFGKLLPPEGADFNWVPSREPYIIHPFLMARRAAIEAVKGYRHVHHCEDTDLYWRLRDVGRLHNLDDVLGDYRLHDGSISGSSLHNGRMMSVSSQLAGLSAMRRHAGRPDLVFDKDRTARLKAAKTLDDMMAAACGDVQRDERDQFELMVGAKMLELGSYRPWELERSDAEFIRRAYERAAQRVTDPLNRKSLRASMNGTSARLAAGKHYATARALCPPALLPGFLLRYALRVFLPTEARKRIKLWRSGGLPAK
jgi:glycosyltransferase involved in cell wall biosynthesis